MPSREIEFVQKLRDQGASPRDIAYAAANIPQEFWDITRDSVDTSGNPQMWDYVSEFVDNMHSRISNGAGLSLVSNPGAGRILAMAGCAILKSVAINPKNGIREYKVWRGNYDTIIEDLHYLRNEPESYELKNKLTEYDILFIDAITYTVPSGSLLSILRTRRDYLKSTILATTLFPKDMSPRTLEVFDIFRDKNKQFVVKESKDVK